MVRGRVLPHPHTEQAWNKANKEETGVTFQPLVVALMPRCLNDSFHDFLCRRLLSFDSLSALPGRIRGDGTAKIIFGSVIVPITVGDRRVGGHFYLDLIDH